MANKENPPWLHYSVIERYENENIQIYFDYFFNLALLGGIFWFFHSMILFAIVSIIYSLYFVKEKLKIIS
jgi:ABC-type multidrug transport system permease subunit